MSLLLSIDTSGSACSVVLGAPDEILHFESLREPRVHASRLVPLISETIRKADRTLAEVSTVAVAKGPGSFTGLRIGVSTAKGLAYGLGASLVGVPTFEAMVEANAANDAVIRAGHCVACAPSRRRETYWQAWSLNEQATQPHGAPRSDSIQEFLDHMQALKGELVLIGENAEPLCDDLRESGVSCEFVPDNQLRPTVAGVHALAWRRIQDGLVEDVAAFEPFYLKEFVAKKGGSPFDRLPF